MTDICFDISSLDLCVKNGDFDLQTNVSEQNGGIFLYGSNFNIEQPTAGVGFGSIVNSDTYTASLYANRWQQQVLDDGAKTASWNIEPSTDGLLLIEATCEYE